MISSSDLISYLSSLSSNSKFVKAPTGCRSPGKKQSESVQNEKHYILTNTIDMVINLHSKLQLPVRLQSSATQGLSPRMAWQDTVLHAERCKKHGYSRRIRFAQPRDARQEGTRLRALAPCDERDTARHERAAQAARKTNDSTRGRRSRRRQQESPCDMQIGTRARTRLRR